jgi:hypothetical protein
LLCGGKKNDSHITFGVGIFANGTHADSVIIYAAKNLPAELSVDELLKVPEFCYAGQESGWMTKAIFEDYCRKTLIPAFIARGVSADKRGLLLLDGHSSRANPTLINLLRENFIDTVVFVAHASHVLQPLDLLTFGVFKSKLRGLRSAAACLTAPEKRRHLVEGAKDALYCALFPEHIFKSFALAGVLPLDRNVVLRHRAVGPAPHLLDSSLNPDGTPKLNRSRCNINGRVLTVPEIVAELLKGDEKIKEKLKPKQKKKKPMDIRPDPEV